MINVPKTVGGTGEVRKGLRKRTDLVHEIQFSALSLKMAEYATSLRRQSNEYVNYK